MDMYQKRKIRRENKSNNQESFPKVSINWDSGIYENTHLNIYKIKFS